MSARFLVTCWPFPGHVFPQVSIARALRDRGHEVAFSTPDQARALIEAEGFPVFAFRHVDESYWRPIHDAERETSARRQSLRIQHQALRQWLVESIPAQVRDISAAVERWRPDVLVTDIGMWASIFILWEALPIPVALSSTFMGPLIPGPDAPPWGLGLGPPRTSAQRLVYAGLTRAIELGGTGMRRRVDQFRAEHTLPPLGCSMNRFTARLPLYLVGNLPELDYSRRDLPSSVHYVGACVWHPPEPAGTAAWVDAVPTRRPWVHVTEGTSHYQDHFLLRAAAEGLADAPMEVIITTGGHVNPRDLRIDLADNIHVTDWVSHTELLPRCAAVVTTGGPATIMAALQAGAPLIVVPTTWDKPENARRVAEAGAGIRLPPRRCSAQGLRDAVERVVHTPQYRATASHLATRFAEADGSRRAAELLEALVHQPSRT